MRVLSRNKQSFYYANYEGVTQVRDSDGNLTGDEEIKYSEPKHLKGVITMEKGTVESSLFGLNDVYDRVIILNKEDDVINEHSVLWIDVTTDNPYNFIVTKVAKSLNFVQLAIRKVEVS